MIRFLLKIWIAFVPIILYLFWIVIIQKVLNLLDSRKDKKIKNGYKIVGEKTTSAADTSANKNLREIISSKFSLRNPPFVSILYISAFALIGSLIFLALS